LEGELSARGFFGIVLAVLTFFVLASCGSFTPAPAEIAVVGTWVSDSSRIVFVFSGDRSYVVEDPDLGGITGNYRVYDRSTGLKENLILLKGSTYNVKFLNTDTEFVIDYGDGITSEARFTRKKQ
jgi:hypothetical protein